MALGIDQGDHRPDFLLQQVAWEEPQVMGAGLGGVVAGRTGVEDPRSIVHAVGVPCEDALREPHTMECGHTELRERRIQPELARRSVDEGAAAELLGRWIDKTPTAAAVVA